MSTSSLKLSKPLKLNLSVYRGDSGNFRISVKNFNQEPIDVSAAVWDADIRLNANDVDVITNFDIVPVVDDTSSVDIILPAENSVLLTGSCVYDIEMRLSGEVITLVNGSITVTPDVSRTP